MRLLSVFVYITLFFGLHSADIPVPEPTKDQSTGEITCDVCEIGMDFVLSLIEANTTEGDLTNKIIDFCVKFKLDNPAVCEGAATEFVPTVLPILAGLVISPREICELIELCNSTKKTFNHSENVHSSSETLYKNQPEKPLIRGTPTGWFLQFSDIHVDPLYAVGSSTECDYPVCCHTEFGVGQGSAGPWGDYKCDIPYAMVQNLFKEINGMSIQPDFIIYTGDTAPHNVWAQSKESIMGNVYNISDMLAEAFLDIPIISAIGNHDTFPVDQFNNFPIDDKHHDDFKWLKDSLADSWGRWLTKSAQQTLREQGYYSVLVTPGLRVIALNSQWADAINFYLLLGEEPSYNQSKWLKETLESARANQERVIIGAHIPTTSNLKNSPYLESLLELSQNYSDVIIAELYGHTHNDAFSVIQNAAKNESLVITYTAPSVTSFTDQNPSFRFYQYDTKTFEILNYLQFYTNLTDANLKGEPTWKLSYNAKEEYGLEDLSPSSWYNLAQRMETNETLFQTWWNNYNTKVPQSYSCTGGCFHWLVCTMQNANPSDC